MTPIWLNILCAKVPEELSADDWNELRRIAHDIYYFNHERHDNKTKKLCRILGYNSLPDIGKKQEKISTAIDFLLAFEKKRWLTGLGIDPFCKDHHLVDKDGESSSGQTLRNKYYNYRKKLKITTEKLFELEYGMTRQEFLTAERIKKKVKISKPR